MARHRSFPEAPLGRPIRVLLVCGPMLERGPVRLSEMLEEHPEVEFLGGICETPGLTLRSRLADLVRRRGVLAPVVLATDLVGTLARNVAAPRRERRLRRTAHRLRERLLLTPDLHDPEVLEWVKELEPDLMVGYGGPILRPELFGIPRFGTLGIHHGRLPGYRGKKTTFWALFNDEARAGVTIQRITRGLDTGPMVKSGTVPARGRGYRRVFGEVEELGLDLYLGAVLDVARGRAHAQSAPGEPGSLYRDPGPGHLLRYLGKRVRSVVSRLLPGGGVPHADRPGVLLLTETYYPMVGGGETQARALAGHLSDRDVPVAVATRRWDPKQPRLGAVDGVLVRRLLPAGPGHLRKWGLVFSAPRAIRAHRHTHPVVLAQGFRVLGIPALLTPGRRRRRVIFKADSMGELSGDFFAPGLRRLGLGPRFPPFRAALALRNRLLRRADAFVAISSVIERELLECGVSPQRIHRIPNGIDLQRFRPPEPGERQVARRDLGLPPHGAVVLFTGRLVSYKGLPLLVEVWGRVAALHPEAHLVLVGEAGGDIHGCEEELRTQVREGPIPRVHMPGAVEEVEAYLRAADVFVFPSREESFGISVVEAMASGLPVVATRAGGLADFVSEDSGALPVPVGDGRALEAALHRLLSDPDLTERLGRRGRQTARERFGMEAVGGKYLELCSHLSASLSAGLTGSQAEDADAVGSLRHSASTDPSSP